MGALGSEGRKVNRKSEQRQRALEGVFIQKSAIFKIVLFIELFTFPDSGRKGVCKMAVPNMCKEAVVTF